MMMSRRLTAAVGIIALLTLGACEKKESETPAQKKSEAGDAAKTAATAPAQPAETPAPQPNPERNAYFGETHVHTSWSFDAYIFGNTVNGPAEAYKYALGEPIKHPMGYTIQITHPLDWMGVTDHSEYVGTVRLANDPGSAIRRTPP